MDKYVCEPCGYVYDPEAGDPDNGIAPGTAFEDLPEDWVCPLCGLGKDVFVKEQQESCYCRQPAVSQAVLLSDFSMAHGITPGVKYAVTHKNSVNFTKKDKALNQQTEVNFRHGTQGQELYGKQAG